MTNSNDEAVKLKARRLLAEAFGDMEIDRRAFLADAHPKIVLTSVALRAIEAALSQGSGIEDGEQS